MSIRFGRDMCGNLNDAESREWLVTNGIGGYAAGTIAGSLTRRYHGLLIAALKPPLGRTLMLTKIDEMAYYQNRAFPLYTNRWADDMVDPLGFENLEQFRLEGTIPTWSFVCADALLEKRIWMQQGANTTYVRYTLVRGTEPLKLKLKTLVNYRDHHSSTQSNNWQMDITPVNQGISIRAYPSAVPLYLFTDQGQMSTVHDWYYGFELTVERHRGLSDREDHLHAATLSVILEPGTSVTLTASTDPNPERDGKTALETHHLYEKGVLQQWQSAPYLTVQPSPAWVQQLVLAADQFLVNRILPNRDLGKTVIAGYPWFGDWGRHAMISLPGLALCTGRPDIARSILETFVRYLDQGMLPNLFPEFGDTPMYNTVDAIFWFFEAVRAYVTATQDDSLLQQIYPALIEVMDWHCRGTRYNIHRDRNDGLLYAGEEGAQLTWMDAKIGEWVVTPRMGKPIEVNALWYNALVAMVQFAQHLGKPFEDYEQMAFQAARGFARFWNPKTGYCYDVLDGPNGHDASLRPNQIFAVSLPVNTGSRRFPLLLTPEQRRAVVTICAQTLLTSHGLRSLSSDDSRYAGHYLGDQAQRDSLYHQGTVWGWLLGPFVQAHLRVYNDRAIARSFLEPMADHLQAQCVGSLSEISDGDAPMQPRGAIAQSWTVAETLRAWLLVNGQIAPDQS